MPVPGRSRASTARSRVSRVYEWHPRDLIAPTEMRGTPSEGVYDIGVRRWVSWALGVPGRRRRGLRARRLARGLCGSLPSASHARVAIRRGLSFWALGVGRWALGERRALGRWVPGRWALDVRQGHPRGADRRRGRPAAASIGRPEAPSVWTTKACSPSPQLQRRASRHRVLGAWALGVG